MTHWITTELPLHACSDAREWCRPFLSPTAAWSACERGDWMLWLAGYRSGKPNSASRRKLVGCCAGVARQVLPIFEAKRPSDRRVRKCLDLCDRYARGNKSVTLDDMRNAAAASFAAAASATYAASLAAASAAYAAAYAASAAYAIATYAAYAASSYAYAAASAAGASYASSYAYAASAASAAASAGASYAAAAADIVRRWYPEPPNLKGQRKC